MARSITKAGSSKSKQEIHSRVLSSVYIQGIYTTLGYFVLNCILWGRHLLGFVLNGDDIGELYTAPDYINHFLQKLVAFESSYRPLGRILYNLYLPFRLDYSLVYFLHLLRFSIVQVIFFYTVKRYINPLKAFILSVFIFYNPVFYYHIFAVASDVNLMVTALLLIAVLCVQTGRLNWVVPIYIFSIFVKENYILLLPITMYSIYVSQIPRKTKKYYGLLITLITSAYFGIRFLKYIPPEAAYTLVYTFSKMVTNSIMMTMWLLNLAIESTRVVYMSSMYWIMHVPVLILLPLWVKGIYSTYKQNKLWVLVLLTTLLSSLVPYIFLNRLKLFYMDVPFIIFGLLFISVLRKSNSYVLLLLLLLTPITLRIIYFNDWITKDFVGNSNTTAKNFIYQFKRLPLSTTSNLCIINQYPTGWPTFYGKIAYFINDTYKGNVISVTENDTNRCKSGFVLQRNGSEFIRLPDKID